MFSIKPLALLFRHLKFWYVDKGRMSVNGTIPLQGRSAILGDKKNNNFLDVAFGKEKMVLLFIVFPLVFKILILQSECLFVITKSGLLCQLNNQRLLEKWVELKVKRLYDFDFKSRPSILVISYV